MLSNSIVGAYTYPAQGSGAVRPHAVTQAGSNTFTYDASGNMLTKLDGAGTTKTLTWDAENKLFRAQINASTYEYTYGADNKRISKTHKLGTGDQVTVYAGGGELEIDATGKWTKYINDDVKRVGPLWFARRRPAANPARGSASEVVPSGPRSSSERLSRVVAQA